MSPYLVIWAVRCRGGRAGAAGACRSATDPWLRYFLAYNPQPALEALAIPVLALIGDLDLQVSAELNIPALEAALAGNSDATVTELDGLNHLFQTAITGAVSEYGQIEETFAPEAMELVSEWILERF